MPRWLALTISPPVVAPESPKVRTPDERLLGALPHSGVPSGLVHHQEDVLVLSSSHLLGELFEGQGEQLGVERGQDQPVHSATLGMDEA